MSAAVFNHPLRQPALIDYLRQARRLRHTYRREPQKLHQSLRYLSACHDITAGIATGSSRSSTRSTHLPATPGYVIDQTSTTIRDFANSVVKQMNGPILRYSERVELMHHAKRIGLRTFDANLIIAAVQNRVKETLSPDFEKSEPEKSISWGWIITISATLQLLILSTAWWLLH